jgi:hypothetical protein
LELAVDVALVGVETPIVDEVCTGIGGALAGVAATREDDGAPAGSLAAVDEQPALAVIASAAMARRFMGGVSCTAAGPLKATDRRPALLAAG